MPYMVTKIKQFFNPNKLSIMTAETEKLHIAQQLQKELNQENPLVETQLQLLGEYMNRLAEKGIGDKTPIEARALHHQMLTNFRFALLQTDIGMDQLKAEKQAEKTKLESDYEQVVFRFTKVRLIEETISNILENVELSNIHTTRLFKAKTESLTLAELLQNDMIALNQAIVAKTNEGNLYGLVSPSSTNDTAAAMQALGAFGKKALESETDPVSQTEKKEWRLEVEGEPTRFMTSREMLMKAFPLLYATAIKNPLTPSDKNLLGGLVKVIGAANPQ